MEVLCGLIVLTCVSLALARKQCSLSHGKGCQFLVKKLDVTTLPPGILPKP
jgi:hypothetical protein